MKKLLIIPLLLLTVISYTYAQKYKPAAGKTILLIGQTWQAEFQGYVNGIGKAPAGSSHYGEIYTGEVNQGNDAFGNGFLTWMNNTYPGAYALVAISIKDNPGAGGFGNAYDACKAINSGALDNQIRSLANTFKNHSNLKFFVRLGYEVSLYMFAQGGDAQTYKDAYNHMAKIIRDIAPNVDFVYHPVRGFNDAKGLYPGDKYVDWVALSIFNHDICLPLPSGNNCNGDCDSNVEQVFSWAKNTLHKPLMIAESAVQNYVGYPDGFNTYLDRASKLIEKYDIGVWTYINSDWPAHHWDGNWTDSRVEVHAKDKWLSIVNKPRYIHYKDDSSTIPTCHDGIQNGDETDVDCGGSCPLCNTCNDGIQNGDETSIDCGGSCPVCPPVDDCSASTENYTYIVDQPTSANELKVTFTSKVNSSFVDLYLSINNGGTIGSRGVQNGNTWTWNITINQQTGQPLNDKDEIKYFFRYQHNFNPGQSDTPLTTYVIDQGCSSSKNIEENGLVVTPNPSEDQITIKGACESGKYMILNSSGKVIKQGIGNEVNISSLRKGVYYFKTEDNQQSMFIKK